MQKLLPLMRELARHALAKKGTQQGPGWRPFDPLDHPHIALAHARWGDFFEEDHWGEGRLVQIFASRARLKDHQKLYPSIRETDWMERDGHIQICVPLDAGIPVEFIKGLIDDAYQIVWNKLDASARLMIELANVPYDEAVLIDRLIETHKLSNHRKEIRKLTRPAVLLLTKKSAEARIPVGATKIGGRPDLPAKTAWPTYRGDRPLAFLAQLNLKEIAKAGLPIKGLPKDGLLSVFSVWGWMVDGDSDPRTPDERLNTPQEEDGWTVVLHTSRNSKLERRKTPTHVNSFKATSVRPTPILSLPNHRAEPAVKALNWTEDLCGRFDRMQMDFRSLQMTHWLKQSDSLASHHLFGGYAQFQQCFPEEVVEKRLTMFLQIGTDANSGMCWGDGGELTFYVDAKALAKGRMERIWGTCQGG